MQNYAFEKNLFKQPQRKLLSRFNLESGSNITPLFSFLVYGTWFTVYKSIKKAATSLFSQLLMLEGKEMRFFYPVLLQRL